MKTGIELIAEKRRQQIENKGYDSKHDSQYSKFLPSKSPLVFAAICYAMPDGGIDEFSNSGQFCKKYWPWNWESFKPGVGAYPASRINELAKAGALIAAEIDRLQNS